MAELKTQKNRASVSKFIAAIEDDQKRKDCKMLLKIFREATGKKPVMWGEFIVGYGEYHYVYASKREGDWPVTGFSPRKANISIYIMPGIQKYTSLLKKLGKYKASKGSCLYIKKLDDVDPVVLAKIIKTSVADMKKMYDVK